MAYIEIRYHRSFPLEVREFGDTGWAVHVYIPERLAPVRKLTVVTNPKPNSLQDAINRACAEVDSFLGSKRGGLSN